MAETESLGEKIGKGIFGREGQRAPLILGLGAAATAAFLFSPAGIGVFSSLIGEVFKMFTPGTVALPDFLGGAAALTTTGTAVKPIIGGLGIGLLAKILTDKPKTTTKAA